VHVVAFVSLIIPHIAVAASTLATALRLRAHKAASAFNVALKPSR